MSGFRCVAIAGYPDLPPRTVRRRFELFGGFPHCLTDPRLWRPSGPRAGRVHVTTAATAPRSPSGGGALPSDTSDCSDAGGSETQARTPPPRGGWRWRWVSRRHPSRRQRPAPTPWGRDASVRRQAGVGALCDMSESSDADMCEPRQPRDQCAPGLAERCERPSASSARPTSIRRGMAGRRSSAGTSRRSSSGARGRPRSTRAAPSPATCCP
jgi:hypothetical protein